MIKLFIEGISYGLFLSILLGPIFIVLTQSSLQKGRFAGFAAGIGIWLSDLLFIVFSFLFIKKLDSILDNESLRFWSALFGGIILCVFGFTAILKKVQYQDKMVSELDLKSLSSFFFKGFFVNTINPFTFVFWISIMTSYVIGRDLNNAASYWFLSGIFITIICTDSLKVLFSEWLRKKLSHKYFTIFNKIAGLGLLGSGIYVLSLIVL